MLVCSSVADSSVSVTASLRTPAFGAYVHVKEAFGARLRTPVVCILADVFSAVLAAGATDVALRLCLSRMFIHARQYSKRALGKRWIKNQRNRLCSLLVARTEACFRLPEPGGTHLSEKQTQTEPYRTRRVNGGERSEPTLENICDARFAIYGLRRGEVLRRIIRRATYCRRYSHVWQQL